MPTFWVKVRVKELWSSKPQRLPISTIGISRLRRSMLFACSNGHYTHKAAQKAAVKYYTMLIKGNYKGFVDGYAGSEDLPDSYREEMGDLMKQFMADGEMPNLRKVTALSDSLGEDSTAYVMLQLQYGDSIFEQIEMPLVLTKKGWRMR